MRDLWKVDLSKADVVAVYGLHPIMKQLGKKMKAELKPGSIVGMFNFLWCALLIYWFRPRIVTHFDLYVLHCISCSVQCVYDSRVETNKRKYKSCTYLFDPGKFSSMYTEKIEF